MRFFLCEPQLLPAQQHIALPAQDRVLTDRPKLIYSIGTADGAEWEELSHLQGVAFDKADNLYVLDGFGTGKPRVLCFDQRGRFLRVFGRRGSGPGEFTSPVDVTISESGDVVVTDVANRAIIVYGATGQHRRNISFMNRSVRPEDAIFSDGRGSVIALSIRISSDSGTFRSVFRQALSESWAPIRLYTFRVEPMRRFDPPASASGPKYFVMRSPMFEVDPAIGVLPDGGIVLTNEPDYTLKLLDTTGRIVRTVSRPIKARQTTEQDRKRLEQQWSAATRGRPRPYELPLAERISVITGLVVDPQGRIWVQRRQPDGGERGPIDLIHSTGRYLGSLPAQRLPAAVSATGRAAYFVTDEFGVEHVEVRQLPSWER